MKTVFDYIAIGFQAVFQFIPYFKPTFTAEVLPSKNFTRLETSLVDPVIIRVTYKSRFFAYPFSSLTSTAAIQPVQIKDDNDYSWHALYGLPVEKIGEYVKAAGNTAHAIALSPIPANEKIFLIAAGNKGRTTLTMSGPEWLQILSHSCA